MTPDKIRKTANNLLRIADEMEQKDKKPLKERYFEQYDKIADVELRERCKKWWSLKFSREYATPQTIERALMWGFEWSEVPEKHKWWGAIASRTDLETNPYIISKWKPEALGQNYYFPTIAAKELYIIIEWTNDEMDKRNIKRNLVCRTKEEAIEKAEEMLNAIKD